MNTAIYLSKGWGASFEELATALVSTVTFRLTHVSVEMAHLEDSVVRIAWCIRMNLHLTDGNKTVTIV